MLTEVLRQWIYPKELRICVPPKDIMLLIKAMTSDLDDQDRSRVRDSRQSGDNNGLDIKALAQLGTHLWRLKARMVEPGSSKPRSEFGRVYRHLDAACDALAEAGVEIRDLTGTPFDHGQSLRPLVFQPVAGLQRRMIVETISPSILLRGKVIQSGEVIVGVPTEQEQEQEQAK